MLRGRPASSSEPTTGGREPTPVNCASSQRWNGAQLVAEVGISKNEVVVASRSPSLHDSGSLSRSQIAISGALYSFNDPNHHCCF